MPEHMDDDLQEDILFEFKDSSGVDQLLQVRIPVGVIDADLKEDSSENLDKILFDCVLRIALTSEAPIKEGCVVYKNGKLFQTLTSEILEQANQELQEDPPHEVDLNNLDSDERDELLSQVPAEIALEMMAESICKLETNEMQKQALLKSTKAFRKYFFQYTQMKHDPNLSDEERKQVIKSYSKWREEILNAPELSFQ